MYQIGQNSLALGASDVSFQKLLKVVGILYCLFSILLMKLFAGDATVSWKPLGDNRSPILHYTIQYNTSFTPDTWEVAAKDVPATETSYTASLLFPKAV